MQQKSGNRDNGRVRNSKPLSGFLTTVPVAAVSFNGEDFTSVCLKEVEPYSGSIEEDEITPACIKEEEEPRAINIKEEEGTYSTANRDSKKRKRSIGLNGFLTTVPVAAVSFNGEDFTSVCLKEVEPYFGSIEEEDEITPACIKEEEEPRAVNIKEEKGTYSTANRDSKKRKRSIGLNGVTAAIPSRSPLFSGAELNIMNKYINKHYESLFAKRRDRATLERKNKYWTKIMRKVNVIAEGERTIVQIQKRWRDLKRTQNGARCQRKPTTIKSDDRQGEENEGEGETKRDDQGEKQKSMDLEKTVARLQRTAHRRGQTMRGMREKINRLAKKITLMHTAMDEQRASMRSLQQKMDTLLQRK